MVHKRKPRRSPVILLEPLSVQDQNPRYSGTPANPSLSPLKYASFPHEQVDHVILTIKHGSVKLHDTIFLP
jgi:hypothetical protein